MSPSIARQKKKLCIVLSRRYSEIPFVAKSQPRPATPLQSDAAAESDLDEEMWPIDTDYSVAADVDVTRL